MISKDGQRTSVYRKSWRTESYLLNRLQSSRKREEASLLRGGGRGWQWTIGGRTCSTIKWKSPPSMFTPYLGGLGQIASKHWNRDTGMYLILHLVSVYAQRVYLRSLQSYYTGICNQAVHVVCLQLLKTSMLTLCWLIQVGRNFIVGFCSSKTVPTSSLLIYVFPKMLKQWLWKVRSKWLSSPHTLACMDENLAV